MDSVTVDFEEISPNLKKQLTVEDPIFLTHSGFDF
jgi:membrane peptidoglycan carboxypeptidase